MAGKRDLKKKKLMNFLGKKSVLNEKTIIDGNVEVNDDVKKLSNKDIRRFITSIHSSGCFLYTNPNGRF